MPAKIEYSLSLLIVLAHQEGHLPLHQAAKQIQAPYRFLTKIVQQLVRAKLIKAKEGKGGGYFLTQLPKQIKIKFVINALGEPLNITRCLAGDYCPSQKNCKLMPVWKKIKDFTDKELNKITLADLI